MPPILGEEAPKPPVAIHLSAKLTCRARGILWLFHVILELDNLLFFFSGDFINLVNEIISNFLNFILIFIHFVF